METYAAQVIGDLNLTPQQKLELKEIIDRYQGVVEESRAELAGFLWSAGTRCLRAIRRSGTRWRRRCGSWPSKIRGRATKKPKRFSPG